MSDRAHGPIRVSICMGSSCFARGNNHALSALTRFLEEAGLTDCVDLRGHLCAEACARGPILTVDGVTHEGVTPEDCVEQLRAVLQEQEAGS